MRSGGQSKNTLINLSWALLLALLPAYGCKGEQELACTRVDSGIAVDGQMADWDEIPTTYLEDEEVVLGACNDDDNLYFMVRFRDEQWARTIHMSGLTLWLDGKGKKGKDFTLTYKGGPKLQQREQKDQNRPEGAPEGGPQRPGMNDSAMADRLTCAVKDRLLEMEIPVDGSTGPQVASALDNGFYVYEFKVPLKESEVRYYGLGAAEGSKITIGATWGKMEMGGRGQRPGGGQGGGPPGGGMGGRGQRRGGGMGGGPPGGGMRGNRPEMPEQQEIWLKTTLASAPAAQETE